MILAYFILILSCLEDKIQKRNSRRFNTKLRNIYLSHKGIIFPVIRQGISGWCKDEEIERRTPSPLSLAEADTGPVHVGRRMRDMYSAAKQIELQNINLSCRGECIFQNFRAPFY